jgi:hypothetical protein
MRTIIVTAGICLTLIGAANAQYRSCHAAYRDCVTKLGTVHERQCAQALARARRTGIFVGPLTGREYTCG